MPAKPPIVSGLLPLALASLVISFSPGQGTGRPETKSRKNTEIN